MIGNMIAKIRKEKGMSKTELAELTSINIGHLTHIEKGERNPSHKALRAICKALDVPYQQLMYTYDKTLNEEQEAYHVTEHISYNRVLAVDSVASFIPCPASLPSASIAVKVTDDSMSPKFAKGSYAFVEYNTALDSKDYGLFFYQDQVLLRKFIIRKDCLILRAEKKEIEDIMISEEDPFYIIGKVIGSTSK